MGGLFSSTETPTYRPTPAYTVSHSNWQDRSTPSYTVSQSNRQDRPRADNFVYHSYRVPTVEQERPVIRSSVVPQIRTIPCLPANRSLQNVILQQKLASDWSPMSSNKECVLIAIPEYSEEYQLVHQKFKSKAPKYFKVTKINRIQNPYLLGCYLLKKEEMKVRYGDVNEMIIFHGTKMCHVGKICRENFNWRLHGDSVGNRFGKGVSFSPKSSYASNYGDKAQEEKTMFLVRVLFHKAVQGNGSMELPPSMDYENKRYDTAVKENYDVIVKFCDNEFYPQYLIYYTGSLYKRRNRNRQSSNPWVYDNQY